MGTRVGTGRSLSRDPLVAGREAMALALAPLEGRRAALVFLFATAGYDQQSLVEAVHHAADGAPVLGCSGEGVIGEHGSEEGSHAVVVAAVSSEEIGFHPLKVENISADPERAARELARQVAECGTQGRLLLLFPDGVTFQFGNFFQTLDRALPYPLVVAGGTAGDMFTFQRTYQYFGGQAHSDSLSAVLISGKVDPQLVISHGAALLGTEKQVTSSGQGELREVEGQPAWDYFRQFLPEEAQSLNGMHSAHLVVAERLPAPVEGFGEFVVRVPLRLDEARGTLAFAAEIPEGTMVQAAVRDAPMVARRGEEAARELRARRSERPLLVIELNCAGRGRLLFGEQTNPMLIRPQLAAFEEHTPWVGLHTFGEIAPVGGETRFHNFTGVLCALYPTA